MKTILTILATAYLTSACVTSAPDPTTGLKSQEARCNPCDPDNPPEPNDVDGWGEDMALQLSDAVIALYYSGGGDHSTTSCDFQPPDPDGGNGIAWCDTTVTNSGGSRIDSYECQVGYTMSRGIVYQQCE